MMQELVAKMTGQEQDWQKMLDKLLVEMDSKVTRAAPPPPGTAQTPCFLRAHWSPAPTSLPKLDRLEFGPGEKFAGGSMGKSLRQQLKLSLYQVDEAARHAEVSLAGRKGGPAGEGPHVYFQRDWRILSGTVQP